MSQLTTKELSALEDILGMEKNLVIKYRDYASKCSDSAVKTKFENISAKHQQHFDQLFGFLS